MQSVSETWLRLCTPSENDMIQGYILLQSGRQTEAHDEEGGGGVALYVKVSIPYEDQHFLLRDLDPGIEESMCVF